MKCTLMTQWQRDIARVDSGNSAAKLGLYYAQIKSRSQVECPRLCCDHGSIEVPQILP
jgi:hypothetical protein